MSALLGASPLLICNIHFNGANAVWALVLPPKKLMGIIVLFFDTHGIRLLRLLLSLQIVSGILAVAAL